MKILYVTMDGFDTPGPNNQMAEVMINDFLDNGYDVHLVQSRRKRLFPDIPASLENKKGLTVDIVDRKVIDKTNFIKRYIDDVRYAFQAMRYWRKVKDADVIFLQSNPTVLFPMLLLKIFKRLPILYCIYDVWPGHAYDIGVVKSKLLYNIFRLLNKPCYKMASAMSVLSEDMRDKVVAEGAKPEKVHIVPAWFDVKTAREIPVEENRFIKKYDIPTDKFYVQFAGTVGYVFNYKTVIELAKRLEDEENIVIQIVGDGNVKDKFMDEVEKLGLKNIVFYPLQPIDIVPDVYSTCNLCIIPLQKGVIGNGVPSKAPILMACNRVIVNSVELDSYYARIFKENNMGIAVDIYDYDGLARAVKELYNSPETVTTMAENAHRYGEEHYSSTLSTAKFMAIFEKIGRKK
ncbi:MAG: glycosyltransferase family 4 protein [Acutalibacteraceae bacterium]